MIEKNSDENNFVIEINNFNYEVSHNIDISRINKRYSSDEFFSCFFFCKNNKSSEFKKIVFEHGGNENLIGWLIPTLYYAEPEEFYEEPGTKFLVDFAYAGYEIFIKNNFDVNFLSNKISSFNGLQKIGFNDLLKDNIYILVISKESFKRTKLGVSELEFLLQLKGLHKIKDNLDISYYQDFSSGGDNSYLSSLIFSGQFKKISIKNHHNIFIKNFEVLLHIYHKSLKNIYDVSSFLTIYQILELVMEHMLERKIQAINFDGIKSWDLKDKLNNITSEKKRLIWIGQCVEDNGGNREIFNNLKSDIYIFLDTLGFKDEVENKGWIEHVYKLRNVIVHNQLAIYRKRIENDIYKINSKFLEAVSEIIDCYC